MNNNSTDLSKNIIVRTELKPGDASFIIYKQALLYNTEYNFGLDFENYVMKGVSEFLKNYNPDKDRVWICECDGQMIGSLVLVHKENNVAQLRYFFIDAQFRGHGLGKKLMGLFMDYYHSQKFSSAFLWTMDGLDSAIALYKKFGFCLTQEIRSKTFGKEVLEKRLDLNTSKFS
ncbi:GNAT family N-acetyltransferase [Rhizosphaericola mali]|uniref:GNAT family N-acetyltransferase n=1 Tax=Rhizosphaericola mali TaxID=2545455 RepID=A0A5P2FVZ4_9BACT|nr:GNAT family N-acetyltransferase [Rhizosphaericola mali]QES87325.1 GNAT family N-acetyltransferase [Rhizosphaericola mali]